MKRVLAVAVSLVALALSGCGGNGKSAATGNGKAALTDVHTVAQFATLFNQASGEPRLVVLVSPT